MGKPTIGKFYFYSSKIAIFVSWGFSFVKAIFPSAGYLGIPVTLSWICALFIAIGSVLMAGAFISLGTALKVGLPEEQTALKTTGFFSISRNPLYLGVFVISIASCLYFPDLINAACTLYGIIIHHRIILGEEKFLEGRFGEEWRNYKLRVRRYL